MTKLFRRAALAAVACGVVVGGTAGPAGAAVKSVGTLKIADTSNGAPAAWVHYLARNLGYAKKLGLTIEIKDGLGATAPSLVISGQADLTLFTMIPAITAARNYQATSLIYGSNGFSGGSLLADPKKYNTVADLRAAKSCTIATFPPGTAAYGSAILYKLKLRLSCTITGLGSVPLQLGAVANGSADVIVGSGPNFAAAVTAGQVKYLIDASVKANQKKYLGTPYIVSGEWGMTANLKRKRAAVVAYLKAIDQAWKWAQKRTDEQVGAVLAKTPPFNAMSPADLKVQVAYARALQWIGTADRGYMTPQNWQDALLGYASWGLPADTFTATDPAAQYKFRIDMSYWKAANGQPNLTPTKKTTTKKK